jgi:large subunit ribosomal protein L29
MKQSEIKELSVDDLKDKLVLLKNNFTDLKLTHKISPLENPLQLRALRKSIARIATELTKRELQ